MVTKYMERNTLRNPKPLIVIILFFSLIFLSIKGKGYNPADLTTGDILKNSKIFRDLYSMHSQDTVSIEGNEIEISLYNLKGKDLIYYDNIPKSIIVVEGINSKGKKKVLKVPYSHGFSAYEPSDKIDVFIAKIPTTILCIKNQLPGQGHIDLILLSDKFFLQKAGTVSQVRDFDHDGIDDLITYDYIWINGLGYLCHADSPGEKIFWKIENGKLVKNTSGKEEYYRSKIERLDKEIKEFPKDIPPKDGNVRLLTRILSQFLIYRLLGDVDEGWRKFQQNIKHYDDEYFYLNIHFMTGKLEKIPIVEIENRMKKSLEEKR